MELVEGKSLDRLIPTKGLPLDEFFELAIPLADALSEAHEHGIVHRDLKPANIMVDSKGRPKILDFGLAKLRQSEPAEDLSRLPTEVMTREGGVLGTYPYMSPEQAEGKTVDHRSDLFSLGTVLYEMTTGQRPFQGASPASLMSSILRDDPPAIDLQREDLPHHLARILSQCLAKDPEARYQRAKDLRQALEELRKELQVGAPATPRPGKIRPRQRKWGLLAVGALALSVASFVLYLAKPWDRETLPPVPPRITSLAVLPFDNLSDDPEQDYYASGITEGLIADLGRIGALRVISRQSVMRYRGSEMPLSEIAEELGVEALIEGSVLPAGGRVRVTAQLLQADPERHLWADTYERDAKDILVLLSDVTRAIVAEVQVVLSPQEEARLASAPEVDPEAHRAYLKGMYFLDQFSTDAAEKAVDYFRQAIGRDPVYSPAWAGLAATYANMEFWLLPWDAEARAMAAVEGEAALKRALELDDSLSMAHTLMAQIHLLRNWDWPKAEAEHRRAIELSPNNSLARIWYAYFLSAMSRREESIREAEAAERLNPLSPLILQLTGNIWRNARDFERALEYYEKTLELTPGNPWVITEIGFTNAAKGDDEKVVEAWRELRTLLAQIPSPPGIQQRNQWLADSFEGVTLVEANRIYLHEVTNPASPIYMEAGPLYMAMAHAMNGNHEEALDWLETSYSLRYELGKQVRSQLIFLKVDPVWDGLRSDARFQDLLRRMNLSD
jgi:serine/threonine-protein kinase